MNDLISRQDAKEKLCSMCRWEGTSNCEECEHPVDDIPSAQPERKTGQWIKCGFWSEGVGMGETYGSCYKCSECGIEVQSREDRCGMNFCYNCGAKMEGEKEIDFFTQGHLHLGKAEVEE